MFGDDIFSSTSNFSTSPLDDSISDHSMDINPANGLLMVGCVDIEGNLWGCDSMSSSFIGGSLLDW